MKNAVMLMTFVMAIISFSSVLAKSPGTDERRCAIDVRDANSVDRQLKSKGCVKGDIIHAQFFVQSDGTFPSNESPSIVAAKNCDFGMEILIQREKLSVKDKLVDVYTLACVLDDYHHLTPVGDTR